LNDLKDLLPEDILCAIFFLALIIADGGAHEAVLGDFYSCRGNCMVLCVVAISTKV
jgi:hypothetical protein